MKYRSGSTVASGSLSAIGDFLKRESAGGIALVLAAALAIALANSPAAAAYRHALHLPVVVTAGGVGLHKSLLHWINDGLMAIFFLLVGLEIKREVLVGTLSSPSKAMLPAVAAFGGMAMPAAIYLLLNHGDAGALQGWAIPTGTDVAFALALLGLAGNRAPPQLRSFLLALAIIDDIGGIIIIAIFYTAKLSTVALVLALVCIVLLAIFNLAGVKRLDPYVLTGIALWACVLQSGVHATLSGIVVAMAIPLSGDGRRSPLERLEHVLRPYVTWAVLPLFAFGNAGLDLRGLAPGILLGQVPLGIALGLILGKQAGVVAATWASVRAGLGTLPNGIGWRQFHAMAVLCGVGFTISLFMSGLAFSDPRRELETRLGILLGSLVSAVLGLVLLRTAPVPEIPRDSEVD